MADEIIRYGLRLIAYFLIHGSYATEFILWHLAIQFPDQLQDSLHRMEIKGMIDP